VIVRSPNPFLTKTFADFILLHYGLAGGGQRVTLRLLKARAWLAGLRMIAEGSPHERVLVLENLAERPDLDSVRHGSSMKSARLTARASNI
jgi:hypothetical protein